MTATEDRKRIEQARDLGGQARRAGKRRGDNPYRGYTKLVRDLHFAWDSGWEAEDTARKAGRA